MISQVLSCAQRRLWHSNIGFPNNNEQGLSYTSLQNCICAGVLFSNLPHQRAQASKLVKSSCGATTPFSWFALCCLRLVLADNPCERQEQNINRNDVWQPVLELVLSRTIFCGRVGAVMAGRRPMGARARQPMEVPRTKHK